MWTTIAVVGLGIIVGGLIAVIAYGVGLKHGLDIGFQINQDRKKKINRRNP
jgi:UDP-N-acetyl-D-mannosaminuronate dehydrogenase